MKRWILFPLLLTLCVAPATVMAAEKPDKAAKRAAILMQKLKQDMEAEKAALQEQLTQEKQAISEQLNAAQSAQRNHSAKLQGQVKRNQQLQAEADHLRTDKQALEAQLSQLNTQLQQQQQKVADLSAQLAQAQSALGVNDAQRKKLVSNVSNMHEKLQSCEAKNGQLYQYGQSLVSLYDDATVYQKIMRSEPFFQLKRVELENILQEKREQLDANKIDTITRP